MNGEFHDIEKELKALVPRPLSQSTRQRIEEEIGGVTTLVQMRWGVVALKVAAVLLVVLGAVFAWLKFSAGKATNSQPELAVATTTIPPEPAVAPAGSRNHASPSYPVQPVRLDSFLVRQQDEGACIVPSNNPMRRIRYHFVDNLQWYDQKRKTTVIKTAPREEEVLVSLPVY